jgi:hypothetical protein
MLAATAAQAAPFGSGGLSISESSAKAESRSGGDSFSFFGLLSRLGLAKLSRDARAAPASDSQTKPSGSTVECEESKKAEVKKSASEKPGPKAGPEPVYLAF